MNEYDVLKRVVKRVEDRQQDLEEEETLLYHQLQKHLKASLSTFHKLERIYTDGWLYTATFKIDEDNFNEAQKQVAIIDAVLDELFTELNLNIHKTIIGNRTEKEIGYTYYDGILLEFAMNEFSWKYVGE